MWGHNTYATLWAMCVASRPRSGVQASEPILRDPHRCRQTWFLATHNLCFSSSSRGMPWICRVRDWLRDRAGRVSSSELWAQFGAGCLKARCNAGNPCRLIWISVAASGTGLITQQSQNIYGEIDQPTVAMAGHHDDSIRAHWKCFFACSIIILSPFQYGLDFGLIGGFQAMPGFLQVTPPTCLQLAPPCK